MKVWRIFLGSILAALAASSLAAQAPVLGSIEAPYAALQSQVKIAGQTYGPGAVAYGPVGTPLVLSGSDLGASGIVQFIPYVNGAPGTPVQAAASMWTSTMVFVTVPTGATSGLVKVTVEGRQSNGMPFVVMPGAYAGSCPAFPPNSQLQITTASLSDGTAQQAYSATLNAQGGTQSYTWAITNGTLPSGLSLNASTGIISGTPSGAGGPVQLTVQVTDSSSPHQTDEAILSLTIESHTLTNATIYTYLASHNNVGNITGYVDTSDGGASSIMGTWSFTYDSLNRLETGTATAGSYSGQNYCWSYDSFGNMTAEAPQSSACPSQETGVTSTASFNAGNHVTWTTVNSATNGFVYDDAGNVSNDNLNQYLYDREGRVCAVNSTPVQGFTTMTGYLYDAAGNRIAKGTITHWGSCDPSVNGFQLTETYVVGPGGEEMTQFQTQSGTTTWQRSNVYGAGRQLATYDANANGTTVTTPVAKAALHYQLIDSLGTRRMQTNSAGQPETDIQSLPFGDQLNSYLDPDAPPTADDATPLHFTGKERDTESGNDYFGARYYTSAIGRFLTPDWSAKVEPVPYSKLDAPQSLNLYQYVGNNPLTDADLDGHEAAGESALESIMDLANDGLHIRSVGKFNAQTASAAWYMGEQDMAQQQSSTSTSTTNINSRAQAQYNNDVPIIAKQLGVSTDEVLDSVHIKYDDKGNAVVIGGHVNMTVDDGSDAQSALAAKLGPGPHGYNENPATGQGQGSEFSRLGTTPSVHLDNGLMHVDRFNASAWGGLGVVPHFFYDVVYGGMHGSSALLPY